MIHRDLHLNSVKVLRVVVSKPLNYHSVRIDQRQHRAIHVLPEKYQFCSLGSARNTGDTISSDSSIFGSCRAKVHYGLCTDFDVFVINESINSESSSEGDLQSSSTATNLINWNASRWNVCTVKKPTNIQSFEEKTNKTMMTRSIEPSSSDRPLSTSSSTNNRSIAARIESYRENIGATLELLNDYDEPVQLQNLIRYFLFLYYIATFIYIFIQYMYI